MQEQVQNMNIFRYWVLKSQLIYFISFLFSLPRLLHKSYIIDESLILRLLNKLPIIIYISLIAPIVRF